MTDNPQVKDYFANFTQQAPLQESAKKTGRSVGPIRASCAFSLELKGLLRELTVKDDRTIPQEAKLAAQASSYWNSPTMWLPYFERSFLGSIRFQMTGVSEFLLVAFNILQLYFGQDINIKGITEKKAVADRG